MPSVCHLKLNKRDATYFGGEVILGTMYLTTANDKRVRGECLDILQCY